MFLNVKMLKGLISALKDNAAVNIWLNIPDCKFSSLAVVDSIRVNIPDGGRYDDLEVNIYLREDEIKDVTEVVVAKKKEAAK